MNGVGATTGVAQVMVLRRQIVDQTDAIKDLRAPAAAGQDAQLRDTASVETGGFAGTLRTAVDQVNAAQHRSSDITAAYERGQVTDVAQVMLARQEAGIAFEATLQVRNKLLSAYQDIMRMGV